MADLTQAQYTALFKRFGQQLSAQRKIDEIKKGFKDYETKVYVEVYDPDDGSQLTSWSLQGVERGTNTDADGRLYVDLSDGAGTRTVSVYKDSGLGAGNKVAEGTKVGDGSVTLTESNSSDMTGTVTNAYTADDNAIILVTETAYKKRADDLPKDDSDTDLAQARASSDNGMQDFCNVADSSFDGIISSLLSAIESETILGVVKERIGATSDDIASIVEDADSSGAITIDEDGVLVELADHMGDNTPAQTIQQNTASASSPSADSDNTGDATFTGEDGFEYSKNDDTISIRCNKTLDSSVETFEIESKYFGDAPNEAVLNQAFKSRAIAFEVTIQRKITDSGAAAGEVASWSFSGETEDNVDSSGKLYGTLDNPSGTIYRVRLWKSSAKGDDDLMCEGQTDGDGTVTLSEKNSSGLSGSVAVSWGSGGVFEVDFKVCKVNDKWTSTITNDEVGKFMLAVGRNWNVLLPSGGSPTIAEDLIKVPEDLLCK